MLRIYSLWKAVIFLSLLTPGCGHDNDTCRTRRCLADVLINRSSPSQPQYDSCFHIIHVPFIEYQTLSVDTKNLRLNTRLQASLTWVDHDLAWDKSVYQYDEVVLPVNKVWTPELHVTNGIHTTMKHSSRDLLVDSDGTLRHNVIIIAEVNCGVNIFNFPFAADDCPVAIQAWTLDGCGQELIFGELLMIDSTHGDWETERVNLEQQRDDRNYIMVSLKIKYLNPFITLLLPSILILLADVISFALPMGGGERNCFKVTLVLSFTMFLIILNDELPGDSNCSPIIRTHFCICLSLLVMSMLVSMLLTGLANDGKLILCWWCKRAKKQEKTSNEEGEDEEAKADISVIQMSTTDANGQMLKTVVNFLEDLNAQQLERERNSKFANMLDKIFFCIYFTLGTVYFCAMLYVMVKYECKVNHFDFWY